MKSIFNLLVALTMMLSYNVGDAQIKNAKTENLKIHGNCEVCKTRIEKAGNLKNTVYLDYDKETEMAAVTYDTTKTSVDNILKRIALEGYDNEKYYAPDDTYDKLGKCCQYKRPKPDSRENETRVLAKNEDTNMAMGHQGAMQMENNTTLAATDESNPLKKTFDAYFGIKDALIKTDIETASAEAGELTDALASLKMESLEMNVHMALMKVLKPLTSDAKSISESKDITGQRNLFKSLSKNMYEVIKVSGSDTTIYYQYCPMQDANWLSMDSTIKNPFYGSVMLSCGSTVETMKAKS